jgi:hypothetical protein
VQRVAFDAGVSISLKWSTIRGDCPWSMCPSQDSCLGVVSQSIPKKNLEEHEFMRCMEIHEKPAPAAPRRFLCALALKSPLSGVDTHPVSAYSMACRAKPSLAWCKPGVQWVGGSNPPSPIFFFLPLR